MTLKFLKDKDTFLESLGINMNLDEFNRRYYSAINNSCFLRNGLISFKTDNRTETVKLIHQGFKAKTTKDELLVMLIFAELETIIYQSIIAQNIILIIESFGTEEQKNSILHPPKVIKLPGMEDNLAN